MSSFTYLLLSITGYAGSTSTTKPHSRYTQSTINNSYIGSSILGEFRETASVRKDIGRMESGSGLPLMGQSMRSYFLLEVNLVH